MKTANKIKSVDVDSLKKEVALLKKEYFDLKLSKFAGQAKDHSQFKKIRSKIARALTLIHQAGHKTPSRNKS